MKQNAKTQRMRLRIAFSGLLQMLFTRTLVPVSLVTYFSSASMFSGNRITTDIGFWYYPLTLTINVPGIKI